MKKGKTSGDCINRNREGTQKSISHVTPNEIQRTYVSSSIVEPTPIRHPNKPPTRRTRAKQCQAKTKSAIYLIYWCMRAPRRSYLQTDTRASRGGWVLAARSKFTTSSKNRRKVSLLLPRKRLLLTHYVHSIRGHAKFKHNSFCRARIPLATQTTLFGPKRYCTVCTAFETDLGVYDPLPLKIHTP